MNATKAFIIAVLGLSVLALLSCRSVQKSSSSNSQTKDSTGYTITNDSLSKKVRETVEEKQEQESKKDAGVTVHFDDEDVDTTSAPIIIQQLNDGSIVIQPGGRKVNKITGQFNQSNRTTNSKAQSKELSKDSSSKKEQSAEVQTKSKSSERDKDKQEVPWLGLVVLGIAAFLFYRMTRNIMK